MAASAKAARTEIYETLVAERAALTAAGVESINEFTPGLFAERAVMIQLSGIAAAEYQFEIHVFRSIKMDADHVNAQDDIDQMVTTVDGALYTNARLSTPVWTVGYDPERQVWGATGVLLVPREDTHYR